MKIRALIFGSTILCALFGCSSNADKRQFGNGSVIDYSELTQETLPPSKTIKEKVHFIHLKTEDKQSLIKSLDKVVVHDRKLYVLDVFTRKLVVFDWNGNPLNTLDRKGRGPGEYLSMEDFCIDARGNIFIADTRTKKVLEYDADFDFVRSWDLPYVSNQIAALSDGNFLINLLPVNRGKYSDVELVVDAEFRDVKCILKYDGPVSLDEVISLPRITCSKYGICYHRTVNDNAYLLQPNGEMKELIAFDFGALSVPEKYRENLESNLDRYANYVTLEECYAVADDAIYGVLFERAREYLFVLDRTTNRLQKKKFECSPDRIEDNEYPIGVSDRYFITRAPRSLIHPDRDSKDEDADDFPVLCLYEI